MSRNVDPLRSNYLRSGKDHVYYLGIADFIVPNHRRGPGTFCSPNPTISPCTVLMIYHYAKQLAKTKVYTVDLLIVVRI